MNELKGLKDTYKKLRFILTKSQKKLGVSMIIMTFIGAIFETIGISIMLPLVQVMLNPEQLKNNELVVSIIQKLNLDTNTKLIWIMAIGVILVYALKNSFLVLLSYCRIKYSCKIQRELSVEVMNSYMKRGYIYFKDVNSAELLRGVRESITNIYQALYNLFLILAEVLTVMCICVFIMMTDLAMAFSIMLLATTCLVVVIFGFRKWTRRCGEVNFRYAAIINETLLETFRGIKEVLVMNRQNYFINSYRVKNLKQQKSIVEYTVARETPGFFIEFVCVMGFMIALCLKITDAKDTASMIPQLAVFAVGAFRILPSLGRITNYFHLFMFNLPSINDTYENFKEVRKYKKIVIKSNELVNFKDKISVENIFWRYTDSEKYILDNVSLEIKKGEAIALIGPSGSGKTTLVDIILGLLSPQKGCIKIDGINISGNEDNLSKLIGYVPQEMFLLDDTIRRNIAFGINEDEIDDKKVWDVIYKAQLEKLIEGLPEGVQTKVGEDGIRFSGGQKQRIAIARALYHDPDILILDEATSALDKNTEKELMEAIEKLRGEKTLIIIAHRLTTIKKCDKIYEVVEGKVIRKYGVE